MSVSMSHDEFFRHNFSRIEIAGNYLQEYLPAEIVEQLNIPKMALEEGTFVDEEMKKHHADLLYTVPLISGDPISAYFLFEHKAQPDREIGFQLLRYMVQIWDTQLRNKIEPRPIIPLVIYHGEKKWHGMTTFQEGLTVPKPFKPFTPDFTYILRDFSYRSDESIRGEIWLKVFLAVLRAVSSPTLKEELFDLVGLLKELRSYKTGVEFIRAIMYYVSKATDRIQWQDLEKALIQQGIDGEEIMTIAQELQQIGFEKGLKEGREEGREEGRRKFIEELLLKHSVVTVSEFLDISIAEIKAIISDENDREANLSIN